MAGGANFRGPAVAAVTLALSAPPPPGQTGAYNTFWLDSGEFTARTSLIDQPGDGRLPALTPSARARADDFTARWLAPPASWHDMSLYDRCITRIDETTMDYRFTVVDPTVYTATWSASTPMQRTDDSLFEYACHEGNYGLYNILAGARAQEHDPSAGR